MQKILIIGATSAIAEATARLWATRGDALFLVGRKTAQLNTIADDLRIRGAASVGCFTMDACDTSAHAAMLEAAEKTLGGLDVALIAHGSLPDQKACEASVELTLKEIGVVLDMSESRVSQIHSKAILKLRARLVQKVNS